MPVVKVKYVLEKDSTVETIHHLKFGDEQADVEGDRSEENANKFEGEVENVFAPGYIHVDFQAAGVGGEISLTVEYSENGEDYEDLTDEPIEDELVNEVCFHSKNYDL